MSLHSLQWDSAQLTTFGIPSKMLPKIVPSSGVVGTVSATHSDHSLGGIDALLGVPISGILGDQQAALFGQTCFQSGEAKCTYGTGCFLLKNTGPTLIPSSKFVHHFLSLLWSLSRLQVMDYSPLLLINLVHLHLQSMP
jgi:glycerol kinase